MRDYQVQGLNWMAGLHFNGINGILADEMVSTHSLITSFGEANSALPFLGTGKNPSNHCLPRLSEIPERSPWSSSRHCAEEYS